MELGAEKNLKRTEAFLHWTTFPRGLRGLGLFRQKSLSPYSQRELRHPGVIMVQEGHTAQSVWFRSLRAPPEARLQRDDTEAGQGRGMKPFDGTRPASLSFELVAAFSKGRSCFV